MWCIATHAQHIPLEVVCDLPDILEENSGMIAINDSTLLFLNDSGNEPCIYVVNDRCSILGTHCLTGIKNTDWEELAVDSKGNIYIADMGNNRNNRTNVQIYKIGIEQLRSGKTATPETIHITYTDSAPRENKQLMYDIESLYWHNDSLYFFSKNRRPMYDGVAWVFAVLDRPGQYTASPVDSITMPGFIRHLSWITAADYEPSSRLLLLLGSDQISVYHHEQGQKPYHGKRKTFSLRHLTQKEAVAFGHAFVFVSDERNPKLGGNRLYRFPKKLLYEKMELDILSLPVDFQISIAKKTVTDTLQVSFILPYATNVRWEVFDQSGERKSVGKTIEYNRGFHTLNIPSDALKPGFYVLNIVIDGQPNAYQVTKIVNGK